MELRSVGVTNITLAVVPVVRHGRCALDPLVLVVQRWMLDCDGGSSADVLPAEPAMLQGESVRLSRVQADRQADRHYKTAAAQQQSETDRQGRTLLNIMQFNLFCKLSPIKNIAKNRFLFLRTRSHQVEPGIGADRF